MKFYQKAKSVVKKYGLPVVISGTIILGSCRSYRPEKSLASYTIIDVDKDGQADLMKVKGQSVVSYYAEGFENHFGVDIFSEKMSPELRKAASKRLEERIKAISNGEIPEF